MITNCGELPAGATLAELGLVERDETDFVPDYPEDSELDFNNVRQNFSKNEASIIFCTFSVS